MINVRYLIRTNALILFLSSVLAVTLVAPWFPAFAQQTSSAPIPVVAIHVSELTQALESMPASPPTPTGQGTTGNEWWNSAWHYFVAYESLKEALRSDGTPFVQVSDAEIIAGNLLCPDGSPRYPILISLASEAVADNEIAPLRNYVNAGGFLFIGSSSFTRYPDGTTRGDFALADEMGLHMVNQNLQNWYQSGEFTKIFDHRIVSHIPNTWLQWRMPLTSEEISWGISPEHQLHEYHYVWQVLAGDADVLAIGYQGRPLITTKSYGAGYFIYHGAMQPLIGHGGNDPGMYAYLIYRNAIEWAFETAALPLIKLSPWRYQYDAAYMVRHDFENDDTLIRSIEASSQYEHSVGAKGDYFFCTGTLREQMGDPMVTVPSIRRAVSDYGATIGSHNGGLKNPTNPDLNPESYDYWHWGPDEVLDVIPMGYFDGAAYALESIAISFEDIEGWFAGVDNGRPGCGALENCPRIWASPRFNSTREDSYAILQELGAVAMSEQKISCFPHWTLSTKTPGAVYSHISLPVSDWFVGNGISHSIEHHTSATMRNLVDWYYDMGALVNLYGHGPSHTGLQQEYVIYVAAKPRIWATNSVGIYDWWLSRSNLNLTASNDNVDNVSVAIAAVSGVTDQNTSIEVTIPGWDISLSHNVEVFFDGIPANPAEYRYTDYGVKCRLGSVSSFVEIHYVQDTSNNQAPVANNDSYATNQNTALTQAAPGVLSNDTDPEGTTLTAAVVANPSHGTLTLNANGSFTYTPTTGYTGTDSFTYRASDGSLTSNIATVTITINGSGSVLFSDDFTREAGQEPEPFTWIVPTTASPYPNMGTFDTNGGTLNSGVATTGNYGFAYTDAILITDHSVEANIRFPQTGTYGGGIFGRLNEGTGQRYAVWIYPGGSTIRLIKFYGWGSWGTMQTVGIPAVGSTWHHVKMKFVGNQIQVFYDGSTTPIIDMVDNNVGGYPPYTSGYVGVDLYGSSNTYGPSYNNFNVEDSVGSVVYNEDFGPEMPDPLQPWTTVTGTWTVTNGLLQGTGAPSTYSNVYTYTEPLWGDYTVEARIQLQTGVYGGGIGGRVDPTTGAHYGVWVYPDGSPGGSNTLSLWKFRTWTSFNGTPMQRVSLPSVGTGWHTLKMIFEANRIQVFYDGNPMIDATDNNYDSRAPYLTGGISADMYIQSSGSPSMNVDDVLVRHP